MPLTTDITTMSVVVAMTTPKSVRKERNLWLRSASMAIQKASRAVVHHVTRWLFVRISLMTPVAALKTKVAFRYKGRNGGRGSSLLPEGLYLRCPLNRPGVRASQNVPQTTWHCGFHAIRLARFPRIEAFPARFFPSLLGLVGPADLRCRVP